tara:strand:+ start:57 stop:191 length:135 start_codon:yes stop_codon:yes gene_type:complete
MIKIISITLLFCFLVVSCGKKGDPVYKDPQKKVKIQIYSLNKIS